MSFQLVRASDAEIVVWHVDHGHIFVFEIPGRGAALRPGPIHDVPGAAETAGSVAEAALRFATEEARSRQLIGKMPRSRLRSIIDCATASNLESQGVV